MADLSSFWSLDRHDQNAIQAQSDVAHSPRCVQVAGQPSGPAPTIWASDLPIWQKFAHDLLFKRVNLTTIQRYKRYVAEFYTSERAPIRDCSKEDLERYEGVLVQSRSLEQVKARMAVIERYWSFAQVWEQKPEVSHVAE